MQTVFVALTALLSAVSALPAAPVEARNPSPEILRPLVISQYQTWTGARDYNTATGLISKPNGKSTDITTLATFKFPESSAGKTCQLAFGLNANSPYTPKGTAQFDVYTSIKPADAVDTKTWPNGNLRDQYVGRLQAVKPGQAVAVNGLPDPRQSFPCPAGYYLGGELVGAGDYVEVAWDAATEGPYFLIY